MKLRGTVFTVFWRSRRYSLDQRGFSLAEVLVALTIFAVGLLAIAGMQLTAIKANSKASISTASSMVAYGVLEEILSRPGTGAPFQSTSVNAPFDMDAATPGDQPSREIGGSLYSAVYSVEPNYSDNTAKVTVTVTSHGHNTTAVGFKGKR